MRKRDEPIPSSVGATNLMGIFLFNLLSNRTIVAEDWKSHLEMRLQFESLFNFFVWFADLYRLVIWTHVEHAQLLLKLLLGLLLRILLELH